MSAKWDARYVTLPQILGVAHPVWFFSAFRNCFHRYLGPVPHDAAYYSKCMLGGVLACGITHAGITPLDVTKCNMQVRTRIFMKLDVVSSS